MKKYRLTLEGGTNKTIVARSPIHAKQKFYGSAYHFNTEKGVRDIKLIKGTVRRTPIQRKNLLGGFKL